MTPAIDLKELDGYIRHIKSEALKLKDRGENFPALARNTERLLASVKMLELNISDAAALELLR